MAKTVIYCGPLPAVVVVDPSGAEATCERGASIEVADQVAEDLLGRIERDADGKPGPVWRAATPKTKTTTTKDGDDR